MSESSIPPHTIIATTCLKHGMNKRWFKSPSSALNHSSSNICHSFIHSLYTYLCAYMFLINLWTCSNTKVNNFLESYAMHPCGMRLLRVVFIRCDFLILLWYKIDSFFYMLGAPSIYVYMFICSCSMIPILSFRICFGIQLIASPKPTAFCPTSSFPPKFEIINIRSACKIKKIWWYAKLMSAHK